MDRRIACMLFLSAAVLTGCFKDYSKDFLFHDSLIEFDASSFESKAPGKAYPVLGPYDKGSGIKTYQINLVGAQKAEAQTLHYRVVPEETTAQEGLHYRLPGNGSFEIPANSSTAQIEVEILNFPAESGTDTLVLELVGNEEIKVSENYKRLGLAISLVGPPSLDYPLYPQLGEESYFNTIAVDLMYPGMSASFMTRWNAMKANLFAFSNGGRTPYNLQFRFGNDNTVRVLLIYTTTASMAFSYAYASWLYKYEPDGQGAGKFVFVETGDVNATNLTNNGVTDPILKDWLEEYDFKVDWVPASVSTPREGAYIGGLFQVGDPSSFVFGELNYFTFGSNTPRPMPTSPAIYSLFDNSGSLYSSVLIDPADAGQSQDFKDHWAAGKAAIQGLAGRQLNQILLTFDDSFYDIILVMAYANAAETGKFLGKSRYWMRMSHNAEMELDYIHRDGNAGVTRPDELFADYLEAGAFKVTRSGNTLTFTRKDNPASYFVGTLGDLPAATSSFSWWY